MPSSSMGRMEERRLRGGRAARRVEREGGPLETEVRLCVVEEERRM